MVANWHNPHWEYHLPINPPGAYRTDEDVVLDHIDIANWLDDDGVYRFQPRLRDAVQLVSRMTEVTDYDPDLDEDSKDEYYDPQFD